MAEFETTATHGACSAHYEGALSFPIFQTATYSGSASYSYSRTGNPTRHELEQTVAQLEGGTHGFAFASGLSAIASVFCLLACGDEVLVSDDLYGGTYRLIKRIWSKFGIRFRFVDLSDPHVVEAQITQSTRMLFLETPTNPMMKVFPIRELAEVAKRKGVLMAVDNTFLTPYFQKPLQLGADIVIHSGTKFLSGHHDTTSGLVVVRSDALAERLDLIRRTLGNALSPFDSWLVLRGLQTLPIRMERHQKNALAVDSFLRAHTRVERVYYPGSNTHPQYALMQEQATGAGGVLSFVVREEEAVQPLLRGGNIIRTAESLGGTVSLLTYPWTMTHASVPEATRRKIGITPRLLRLSVGLENQADLLADLEMLLRPVQQ